MPSGTIAVAAEDGRYTILGPDMTVTRTSRHPSKLRAIAPHPSAPWLAVVADEGGSLQVQDFAGGLIHEIEPPPDDRSSGNWFRGGFDDCFFDESGGFLWLARSCERLECEVRLIETAGWSLVARAMLTDPFGGSSLSFHSTGRPGLVSLWVAAVQDGQQIYWLQPGGDGLACALEPRLSNTTPPVFSPSGGHLLVLDDCGAVRRYEFPGMAEAGTPLETWDDDNPLAESMAYLDERRALLGTGEGRIFLADTPSMTIEREVELGGHEPRPIGEYYPALAKERGLGTDIQHFAKLGGVIVFVYRRDRGDDLVLVCSAKSFIR